MQPACYRRALRGRLAGLTGQDARDVQLTISGMAAIFKAFHVCKEALPGRKVGGRLKSARRCWLVG